MSAHGLLHELPVLPATDTDDVRCSECAHCCTYIAAPIDAPTDRDTCSSILWYLYHENIRIYQDNDKDRYIQFWTRCEALRPDGMCGVYEVRPDVCEDFTADDCEVTNDDYGELAGFDTAQEFVVWLKKNKPRLHERLRKARKRRDLTNAPAKQKAMKNASLVVAANGHTAKTKKKKKGYRAR